MRIDLQISAWAYIMGAAGILILPLDVVTAVVCAAAIHEIAHILILRIYRVPFCRITVGLCGARIQARDMSAMEEMLCAAAGPAGSLSLLVLSDIFPLLALAGLIHGIFNLIPIYPMDGGRVLRAGLCLLFPRKGKQLATWIGIGVVIAAMMWIGIRTDVFI